MFHTASLLALCHQIPGKVMNEPPCAALADPGGLTGGKASLSWES